jgi:hypothetical protein
VKAEQKSTRNCEISVSHCGDYGGKSRLGYTVYSKPNSVTVSVYFAEKCVTENHRKEQPLERQVELITEVSPEETANQ